MEHIQSVAQGSTSSQSFQTSYTRAASASGRSVVLVNHKLPFKRFRGDDSNKTDFSYPSLSARDVVNSDNCWSVDQHLQPAIIPPTSNMDRQTRALLGGKGLFLSVMQQANIPVPPFTVVDTHMVATLEQQLFPSKCLLPFLPDIQKWSGELCSLKQLGAIITELPHPQQSHWLKGLSGFIASEDFYQQVKNTRAALDVRDRYLTLQQQSNGAACIIRSSGVEEDRFGDAQAGRYDSRVHGGGDVLKTCLQVLSSAYRPEVCPAGQIKPIALIMQQCIHCQLGGVVISHSSLDDDTIQVEYAPGQPRGAVSGDSGIRPHRYTIRRYDGKSNEPVYQFTPGDITTQFVLEKTTTGEGYIEQSTSPTTAAKNIRLAYQILQQVHDSTEQLEGLICGPVDTEFGVDDKQQFYVFQCRPVTQLPGGTRFSAAAPPLPLAEGTMVSEGCRSGIALVVTGPVNLEQLPPGAIVFADHASDWMLAPDILQRAGGFVFRQGGTNDHVAITLRQAGVPCLLAGAQYPLAVTNSGQQVTLVAGTFAGNPGAYLLESNQTAYWQANSTTSGQDTVRLSAADRAEPANFTRVDEGFGWLNRQNRRLLDYFHADRLISRCLGPGRSKAVSMSADRSDLLLQLDWEIRLLQEDLSLFRSGYQRFLGLATASKPDAIPSEIQPHIDELPLLEAQWEDLKGSIDDLRSKVVMPLTTDRELPAQPVNFRQWLWDCQSLLDKLQKLTQPRKAQRIRSVHDFIYWLHEQYVSALAPVAEASGQGEITKIAEGRALINMLSRGVPGLLNDNCISVLTKLEIPMISDTITLSMLNMADAACINAILGVHVCTISMLEQAEGGKGRTLRLDISDNFSQDEGNRHLQGKLTRFWFLVQTLRCASLDESSWPMAISFNKSAGKMSIEYTQFDSTLALQGAFVKLVTILSGLRDMDIPINNFTYCDKKNPVTWDLETLLKKCQNGLDEPIANWTFKHCLVQDAVLIRSMQEDRHYDYTFLDYLDSEYKLFFVMAKKSDDWFLLNMKNNTKPNAEELRQIFIDSTNHLEPDDAARVIKELLIHTAIASTWFDIYIQLLRKDFDLDNDRDLVLFLTHQNPAIYKYVTDKFKDDTEIAKSAIELRGDFLKYASNRLKNDKSLVLLAVKDFGHALQYASTELKNDPDVVLSAVRSDEYAFCHAGPIAKNNQALLRAIIEVKPGTMDFVAEYLKKDKDSVLPLLS